jgi:hypothetical protein
MARGYATEARFASHRGDHAANRRAPDRDDPAMPAVPMLAAPARSSANIRWLLRSIPGRLQDLAAPAFPR